MAAITYGPKPLAGSIAWLANAAPPFLTHSTQFAGVTSLPFGSFLPYAAVPSGPNRPPRPGAGTPLSLPFRLWQLAQLAVKIACPRPAGVSGAPAEAAACWACL